MGYLACGGRCFLREASDMCEYVHSGFVVYHVIALIVFCLDCLFLQETSKRTLMISVLVVVLRLVWFGLLLLFMRFIMLASYGKRRSQSITLWRAFWPSLRSLPTNISVLCGEPTGVYQL